jgi:hypothetical protein
MEKIDESPFKLKQTVSGLPTLGYEKDDQLLFIHSAYDPEHEAVVFARKLRECDTSGLNHVFFYGIGLGYHIEAILKDYPGMFFSIYEPNPDAFCHFIMNRRLDDLPLRRLKSLYIQFEDMEAEGLTIDFFHRYHDHPFFVTLPAYERLFKEEYDAFATFFTDAIRIILSNRYTILAFEKRWTMNSMSNFIHNLHNRNIFNHEPGLFKGKPAILVAAGPSLADEYDNLRRIKEEGTAYIFTVGSAIKALVDHGIEPHAAFTMDPSDLTVHTFAEIIKQQITTIPHIYGTSVGLETLPAYPGPQIFMVMDKDCVSPYFLKMKDGSPVGMVNDAPTVAITTLQLLSLLGFNPVIFVGQNLGFRNKQTYAEGIKYEDVGIETRDHMATEIELARTITIEDVYGQEMLTNSTYYIFRKSMEKMLTFFPDTNYVNTTKGGANIEGAPFQELGNLMQESLLQQVTDNKWLDKVYSGSYDVDFMHKRAKTMNKSLTQLKRELDKLTDIVDSIKGEVKIRNASNLGELFKRLDKSFNYVVKNPFYRVFISPLNMLETAILGNGMALIHAEKHTIERAGHVAKNFGRYILECKRDIISITDKMYPFIEKALNNYKPSNDAGLSGQTDERAGQSAPLPVRRFFPE